MSGCAPEVVPESAVSSGMRFSSRTLGCKVNQVESEQIAAGLLDRGFEAVSEESADVVIVNTCTVTGEADSKARKAIRHALALPNRPRVVVTGCLAALATADIEALGDRVVVEPDVANVAEKIAAFADAAIAASPCPGAGGPAHIRVGRGFHTRAMVKVQDGCDAFCSYCIVPYARGLPRSVALDDVVSECRALSDWGVREVVLTGINLGRYDHAGVRLADLVSRVAETGIVRLRLSSVEPLDLTDELLDTLASTPSVCEHLHVPLQSGSDAVLRKMGRTYTTAEYGERISRARAALPGLAVSTDVLVGFPGESDDQAEETLGFCRRIGFSRLHVFRYSPRRGTPAAVRPEQVDAVVRAQRAAKVRALGHDLRVAHARTACGSVREVLIERVSSDGPESRNLAEGVTRDYLRVRVPAGRGPESGAPGSLVRARLGGIGEDGVAEGVIVAGSSARVDA